MSEFQAYLEKLRAALDVSPQRADEIVVEARSHLEAKAAELQTGGLSHAEAVREALASFGEAGEMAGQLTRANGGGRTYWALRAALGIAVMLIGLFAAAAAHRPDNWIWQSGPWLAARFLGVPADLVSIPFQVLRLLMLTVPPAVLSGAIAAAGRPRALAAALPALTCGAVIVIVDSQEPLLPLLLVASLAVLVLWLAASLGARAVSSRSSARRLLLPCAVISLGSTLIAGPELARSSVFAGALGLEAAFALLLLVTHTRERLDPNRFARVVAAAFAAMSFGVLGLSALVLVTVWPSLGADSIEGRLLLAWALVTTALPLGIAAVAGREWGRTRPVADA